MKSIKTIVLPTSHKFYSSMVYFTTETNRFLRQLSENNSSSWFKSNKERFEKNVKLPFEIFVNDLIVELGNVKDLHSISPKDCIFRINRDVRFSKDKSPYKTFVSALISPYGRKNKAYPGLYIQISADEIRMYSGSHDLTPVQLKAIRQKIYDEQKNFSELVKDPSFVSIFQEIKGEKNVKLSHPFSTITNTIPQIANQEFYYFTVIPIEAMLKPDFINIVLEKYKTCRELNQFLIEGLGE